MVQFVLGEFRGVPYVDSYIFNVFTDVTLVSSDGITFETSRLFLSSISPLFYKIFKEFDQEVLAEDFYVVTEIHSTELNYFLELATRGKIFSDLDGQSNIKKFEDVLITFGVTLPKLQLERCNLEGDDLGKVIELENCVQDSTNDAFGHQQQPKHISFLSIEDTEMDIQQQPDNSEGESEVSRFELSNVAISFIETGPGESCESENQQSCDTSMSAGPWIMPSELTRSNQELFDTSMEDSNQMIHKSNLTGIVDFNVDEILSSVGIMPVSSQDASLGFYQRSAFGSVLQDNDMSDGSSFDVHTLNQSNMENQLNVECFRENLINDTSDGPMHEGSQSIFVKNLPPGLEILPIGPVTSSEMVSANQLDSSLMNENLSIATMSGQNTNETTDDLFSLLSSTGTSSQKCLSLVLPTVQEFVHSTSSDNGQSMMKAVEPFPTVNDDMFIEDLFVNEAHGDWMDKSRADEIDGQYSVVILADSGMQNIMEHQENHGLPQMSMEVPQDSLSFDLPVNQIAKPKRPPRKKKTTQKMNEAKKTVKCAPKQATDKKTTKQRKRKIGKSTFKNEVFPDLITMQNLPKKMGSIEFESKVQEDPEPTILEKKCPYCPNVFIDENLLRYHIGKHEIEPDLNEFVCALCDSENRFPTLEDLKSHRFEVHLQKSFVCTVCNKTFPGGEYENFKKHLSSHWYGKAKDPVKCVACGFTSAFKNNYEKHFANWGPYHNGQCATCQEEFFTWEDHLNHVNTVHGGVFKYRCGLCEVVLNSVKQQMVHRSQEHLQIGQGIVVGSVAFLRSEKLKKVRNYNKTECTTCGKLILTRHFEVHTSLHNPIGSFPCPKCRKVYSHPKILEEHLKHYHEEFPCQHCGVVLNERRKYDRHILSLHTPEHQKPYQCTLCNPPKGFHRKLNYDDHVNTHTNNRPHKCRFCDETFSINPSRYKHEKRFHADLMPKRMM